MKSKIILLLAACFVVGISSEFVEETLTYGQFPDDFIWAAATASYQIEGAHDVDGKFFFFKSAVNVLNGHFHFIRYFKGRTPSIWVSYFLKDISRRRVTFTCPILLYDTRTHLYANPAPFVTTRPVTTLAKVTSSTRKMSSF